MNGKKLVAVAASAAMIASATPCVALAAEDANANEGAVATQSVTSADVKVKDVTIKASSLKTNLMQMKWQIKDLMLVSPTSGVVYDNLEVKLPSNLSDLQNRKPGSYEISFIYAPDVVGTATLTLVSDDAPAETPSFSAADAAAVLRCRACDCLWRRPDQRGLQPRRFLAVRLERDLSTRWLLHRDGDD